MVKKNELKKGVAQLVVVVVMAFLALGLPLTTKLVQQSQENRSQAAAGTNLVMSDGGGMAPSCKEGSKRCVNKYIRERCDSGKWIKEDCQKMNPVGHMVCISGWCKNPSSSSPLTPTPRPISSGDVKYDFNLDGQLGEKDVQIIQEYIVSLPKILYDINNDNQVDIMDITQLIDVINSKNSETKKPTFTPTLAPIVKSEISIFHGFNDKNNSSRKIGSIFANDIAIKSGGKKIKTATIVYCYTNLLKPDLNSISGEQIDKVVHNKEIGNNCAELKVVFNDKKLTDPLYSNFRDYSLSYKVTMVKYGSESLTIDCAKSNLVDKNNERIAINDGNCGYNNGTFIKFEEPQKISPTPTPSSKLNNKTTPSPKLTPTQVKNKNIVLTPNILNLEEGKSWKVKAVTTLNKKSISYQWTSDNPNIATVDINGLVTGKKIGKTNIRVKIKDSDITSNLQVIVKAPIPIKSPTPTLKLKTNIQTNISDSTSNQTPIESSDSFNPVIPSSFNNSYLTDTLKIWRSRPNSNYSIYNIWAKNPYKQFHTYSSSSYGKSYDSIGNIMKKALDKVIDKDKLTMLVNGSHHVLYGFTPKNLPDSSYKEYNHGGLIIEEGKIIRDDPLMLEGKGRARYLALDNKNVLNFYSDSTNLKSENRKTMYEQTKNSGTLNTIKLIGGDLLINKGVVTTDTRKNSWQGFCQVNKNNFVHIVVNPNSRNVMSRQNLGNILKSFGCTNAYLLDGGGSSNVWIKDQDSTKIKKLQGDGGSRNKMWNIFYWSEL